MTTVQITMLVVMPLIPVIAVLFCKSTVRRALALHPSANPDPTTDAATQFARAE